ncbi:electron transporter [Candidatus Gracilibacteria bacterium]|nr:MAG: electron transporter [Candidatus Gracilibacteria bacterium]
MNILLYIKRDISLNLRTQELLNIASLCKKKTKGKLYIAIFENSSFLKDELIYWEIDKIFYLEEKKKNMEEYLNLFQILLEKEKIDCIMMGNTLHERELAPYLSANFEWNLVPNIISFEIQEHKILWNRFLYGTRAIEESETKKQNIVLTFSGNIYKKDERRKTKNPEEAIVKSNFSFLLPYTIQSIEEKKLQKNPLETAKIVIGVGKGIKGKENFSMIEELANLLRAAIGVTRSVVDNGWRPEYEKVGQTGKIIKPELYLGFGISGAMQHMVGVQQARHIIMVNNNPNAESFRYSDFGIVADLFDVIPQLIQYLKEYKINDKKI